MTMTSTVMVKNRRITTLNEAVTNCVDIGEVISNGLVGRLFKYATKRACEAGFDSVMDWDVEVYTLDGREPPPDRSYCVKFKNSLGGYIEVIGILTNRGWPSLDHGFAIGQD